MKISFLDFWDGFDVNNNFFLHALSMIDKVELTNPSNSDYIIFSCFGNQNIQFRNKKRIFYTGENLRPDYNNIDFSLSFDFTDNGKNIRLPLWMLQIDWFNKVNYTNPQYTIPCDELFNNKYYNKPKDKFCSIVFNSHSPYRYEIIEELSKYKKVDCFGKPFGNWFYGEDVKLDNISNYKFNICFENSIYPGYYTEKPIHAKSAGCIPIYWSDENISKDFNKNAFINLSDFNNNVKDLAEYIIEVDKDEDKYIKLKNENLFLPEQDPKIVFNNLIENLKKIIN
jgi:hypothetical protein